MAPYHRKLTLLTLLGDRFELSVHDIVLLLQNRKTVLYICLALTVLITSDAPGLKVQLAPWMLVVVWPIALITYIATTLSLLMLYAPLQARFPALFWPLPLSAFLGVLPAALACELAAWLLMYGDFRPDFLSRVMIFVPSVLVFETVFFRFVVPNLLPSSSSETAPPTPQEPAPEEPPQPQQAPEQAEEARHLLIGNQKVAVAHVRHIEAREHHVKVTLDGATLTQRARLSDIVAQTRPEDGCQPHRSWWVSRSETLRIERDGKRHVLKLTDDTRIPVARTRLDVVQQWVEEHVAQEDDPTPKKA